MYTCIKSTYFITLYSLSRWYGVKNKQNKNNVPLIIRTEGIKMVRWKWQQIHYNWFFMFEFFWVENLTDYWSFIIKPYFVYWNIQSCWKAEYRDVPSSKSAKSRSVRKLVWFQQEHMWLLKGMDQVSGDVKFNV